MRALGAFARQGRDALQEALAASWVATQAWWRVAVLLGRPVLRLLLHLWRLGARVFWGWGWGWVYAWVVHR